MYNCVPCQKPFRPGSSRKQALKRKERWFGQSAKGRKFWGLQRIRPREHRNIKEYRNNPKFYSKSRHHWGCPMQSFFEQEGVGNSVLIFFEVGAKMGSYLQPCFTAIIPNGSVLDFRKSDVLDQTLYYNKVEHISWSTAYILKKHSQMLLSLMTSCDYTNAVLRSHQPGHNIPMAQQEHSKRQQEAAAGKQHANDTSIL